MNKSLPTHYTAEERKALISQWHTSGKTKKDFCTYRGINPQTFYSWFKPEKVKKEKPSSKGFIPLQVEPTSFSDVFAELTTPSGIRITFHQQVSASFIKALF
jgi:transposase-like protein